MEELNKYVHVVLSLFTTNDRIVVVAVCLCVYAKKHKEENIQV